MKITWKNIQEIAENNIKQLLPCPFCGETNYDYFQRKIPYKTPSQYSIGFRCINCHCKTGMSIEPEKLVELWNSAKR